MHYQGLVQEASDWKVAKKILLSVAEYRPFWRTHYVLSRVGTIGIRLECCKGDVTFRCRVQTVLEDVPGLVQEASDWKVAKKILLSVAEYRPFWRTHYVLSRVGTIGIRLESCKEDITFRCRVQTVLEDAPGLVQ
jgi:hypothetical protein